jgi:hypothetical protein
MRKRSHKCDPLLFLSFKKKITAEDLKRVFSYCSEHCKGDKQKFIQNWQSYNNYWSPTRLINASTSEVQFLDNFMNKLIQDVEYFVDAQRTCLTETFHILTTKYCPKKTSYSFKKYIMMKILAAHHFNENHSNSTKTFNFREKIIKGVLSR